MGLSTDKRTLAARIGVGLGLVALLAAGWTLTRTRAAPSMEAAWGIRVESIRLTAASYLIDVRYRITDPEKAAAILDRSVQPYLIEQESGARLAVPNTPKLGKLRQTTKNVKTDRSYFVLFANPGRFVKPGSKVTLVIGDLKLEDLPVEAVKVAKRAGR